MPLMSRKVDYALLILAYLHHRPEGGCAREIADRFGISRAFVANILKELCHKEFVTSYRGVKGGYVLQRPAEATNLAELMEALDDAFRFAECNQMDSGRGCTLENVCPIKGPIAEIHNRIREVLRSVTLAELMQSALSPGDFPVELGRARCEDPAAAG
jgi:Rrf2 family protein